MGKAGVVECRGFGMSIVLVCVRGIEAVGDVVDVLGVEGLELGEEGRLFVVGEVGPVVEDEDVVLAGLRPLVLDGKSVV